MAKFQEQLGKSIDDAFKQFHEKNPKVWETFQEQCLRAIRLGRKKISAKQLVGYIRWHVSLQTNTDDGFKINDAFTSRYSREFAKKYPQYQEMFNYRELRTGNETIKKVFLTDAQITLLRRCHRGYILNVGNTLHVHWMKNQQEPVDRLSFERLINIGFIEKKEPISRIQKYKPTEKGKKYLKSVFK